MYVMYVVCVCVLGHVYVCMYICTYVVAHLCMYIIYACVYVRMYVEYLDVNENTL